MTLYKCIECGFAFDRPHEYDESHGFNDGFAEHFSVCPNCGGDYEELDTCDTCGGWKRKTDRLCTNCRTRLIVKFRNFRDYLTADEEEELQEMVDADGVCGI